MVRTLRVAAVGDLHCTKGSEGAFQSFFAKIGDRADVFVLCGDLTDYGTAEEARVLAKELSGIKVPKLAVLGNHDFESDAPAEVVQILTDAAGITVLDGTAVEIQGVGFAGAKGFAGGFGARALQSWGETPTKAFVRAAIEETLKLESALARLRTSGRVALLHYSPIGATVDGEPAEIYPFPARAGSRNPSTVMPRASCSTAMRIADGPRAPPPPASRSTTWRCRCFVAPTRISRHFASSKSR